MTVDANLVDEIVSRVLAALKDGKPEGSASGPSPTAVHDAPSPDAEPRPQADDRAVYLAESVVTGALLQERASGARRIVVKQSAVLTPSAWDFLRAGGVEICRDGGHLSRSDAKKTQWLVLEIGSLADSQRAVQDALADFGNGAELASVNCVDRAAERIAQAVSRKTNVIALTREAERAACLANRHGEVRAAVVWQTARLSVVRQSLDPNVWVIDPSGRSYFELKNLLKKLMTGVF